VNDPLPSNTPPSARIGLDSDEALSLQRLRLATVEQKEQIARHGLLHGLLPLALEDDSQRRVFTARITSAIVPFTQQVVSKLRPPSSTRTRKSSTRRLNSPSTRRLTRSQPTAGRFGPYLIAAAVAACVAIAVVWRSGDADARVVAILAHSESATWKESPGPLIAGVRLRLTRGLVELDLRGKGRLVLDGPADLELISATQAVLHSGRLVLNVTPAGHGYQVETPGGRFIDLGTRFGVIVGADGTTEAHVMEGAIAAFAQNSKTEVILTRNNAVRLSGGHLEKITADPGAFYTSLPPHAANAPQQVRWRMDEGNGNTARAEVYGYSGATADLTLKSVRGSTPPTWTSGQHGSALAFDGHGGYAESAFPGIGGTQARSVTCWIRMPRDFTTDGFAIVSWGHPTNKGDGEVWQVSLNPLKNDGPIGRIRLGTHGGILVGTTDLRDDHWHHIAVVMFGGARPDIGTHVLVYLDGELEPISRRTLQPIDTRIVDGGHGVWVGRNVTHVDETLTNPNGFLRGVVDDLTITADALSQRDIRRLMEAR
jgi:Concanavalin A-like lectin/glucanases superfamily